MLKCLMLRCKHSEWLKDPAVYTSQVCLLQNACVSHQMEIATSAIPLIDHSVWDRKLYTRETNVIFFVQLFTFVIGQSFTTMLCSMEYGVFLL